MASVYQHHPTQLWGSHYHPNLNAGISTGVSGGADMVERSREYDRALKASQMVRSRFQPPPARNAGDIQQSLMVGMDMAQTAILGESEGTTTLPSGDGPNLDPRPFEVKDKGKATSAEGRDGGEGVGEGVSGLGESYVDGTAKRPKLLGLSQTQQQEEDEELLADGGVLGLLAQIYGRQDRTGL